MWRQDDLQVCKEFVDSDLLILSRKGELSQAFEAHFKLVS